jgi:hypothetical protein
VWLYLLFEDAYIYADRQRSTKEYADPKILHYWQNILRTDEIIAQLHIQERVNEGKFQSYRPPHAEYTEVALDSASNFTPMEYLKTSLIEATTTQLQEDPLKRAVVLLEDMDGELKTALDLFVQTVNIRMQKTLQILQFLFIVAAIAQLIQLITIGPDLASLLAHDIPGVPWYSTLVKDLGADLANAIISTVVNLIVLAILTFLSLGLLKIPVIKNLLDRLLQ